MKRLISILAIFLMSAGVAQAQNTGGVLPPGFGPDHKSAQYRIAVDLDSGNFAQRVHYQQSLDSQRLWRVVLQTRETASSDFDFDFLQAELFWELTDPTAKYRSGVRFDARLRDDNRPGQFGLNWSNNWKLNDGWNARVVALSAIQVGENRSDGISLAPRAQLSKALEGGPTVGVEYFGSFGNTENFTISKAGQTVGPFVSTRLVGKTSIMAGVQFGLTDAAPDADLRLWLTQGF